MGGIIEASVAIAAAVGGTVGGGAAVGAAMIATGVGMTMSVVGAVTKDKTLSQIGMGFSAAGALTGVGAAAGLFDSAVDAGTQEALGQGIVAASNPDYAAATGAVAGADQEALGQGIVAGTPMPAGTGTVAASTAPNMASPEALSGGIGAEANAPAEPGTMPAQAQTIVSQPGTPASEEGASSLLDGPSTAAPAAPQAPTVPNVASTPSQVPSLASLTPNAGTIQDASSLADLSSAMQKAQGPLNTFKNLQASETPGWWGSLDPSTKAAIMLVGGQTAAGGVGGIFTGMQAQKQLDLQRLIDQENRNQFNLMFARETSSPGLIQYGATNGKATV